MAAAVKRYTIMQPLTSGYDSRALLAASKDFRHSICYYTFKRPGMPADYADLLVPQTLSEILGIDYQTISTEPLKEDFLRLYESEHIVPRVLSKTQNIQHHYCHSREQGNVLDVKGSGGGMLRLVYGKTPGGQTPGGRTPGGQTPGARHRWHRCRDAGLFLRLPGQRLCYRAGPKMVAWGRRTSPPTTVLRSRTFSIGSNAWETGARIMAWNRTSRSKSSGLSTMRHCC